MSKAKCNKKSDILKIMIKNLKVTQTIPEKAIKSALKVFNNPNSPSIRSTALNFSLAEATLRCVFKKDHIPDCSGPATVLSSYKEEQLAGYYKNMQRLGFGLTRSGVNHCMMNIMNNNSYNHTFKDSEPGKA